MKREADRKIKTSFFCQNCGHQSPKWLGKCPSCGEWNQFVEEEVRAAAVAGAYTLELHDPPQAIEAITADEKERIVIGMTEMDRVLGGGIVPGSANPCRGRSGHREENRPSCCRSFNDWRKRI